ncbi:cadmium-translocating P-type ATPase [Jiella endophytica]|uniref:Cadmium-translocating P-type ATPase n=1 Tax=Jiella endophytica TaxID=2558362 RepID=A0A4Y8RRK3_9HYPH|nr:heavy metal translocating P-type ATPase [Jiella endophytica]TFF20649.1 cadmium-translocating P-type ATPase [Jiella endophytica]TFF26950.1 cadmium-translocating P-type ATPase [Jiella endophytica]
MSCCSPALDLAEAEERVVAADLRGEELRHAGRVGRDGSVTYVFAVPDVHCGACIAAIEDALKPLAGVDSVRVNLTLRRVTVVLSTTDVPPLPIAETLARLGYPATPVDLGDLDELARGRQSAKLLTALGIAGFAAANVMLLSVSVWAGADDATRDLFHLISALIAIPAVAFSGQVFFRSAFGALRAGRLNMDVPISLALLLALGMSIVESLSGGAEAYFDAVVTLTFFLLVGRYLDELMRERARSAVLGIARLAAKGATRIVDGAPVHVPIDEVEPGMRLRVSAGERMPVDARIVAGESTLDRSLVTGESEPLDASAGMRVEAGVLNLSGPLDVEALSNAKESFLAEIMAMMEAAEVGRGAYVRVADRMARLYAPAVHLAAAVTFLAWLFLSGGDWYHAITIAIAVLIVTCPCALGLAVPVVHVVGASRLFSAGILMKDGSALERLAEIDTVVFDKTGTLTTGTPALARTDADEEARGAARALAARSSHPAARAIHAGLSAGTEPAIEAVREIPGVGVEALVGGRRTRLGRPAWVAEIAAGDRTTGDAGGVAFAFENGPATIFELHETLREGAVEAASGLAAAGLPVELLSGDAEGPVARVAAALSIGRHRSGCRPEEKIARIRELQAKHHRVLMIGDGLNDAPSLAAGDVSMAPASACDAGRLAADFVFTRDSLTAVPFALAVARRAKRLVQTNFALAIVYNLVAVPLAMAGFVTPLVAAIAMSASSILVVANSLRLARGSLGGTAPASAATQTESARRPQHLEATA